MNEKEIIEKILSSDDETEVKKMLVSPQTRKIWEEFCAREEEEDEKLAKDIRRWLGIFSDDELDAYITGQADERLCREIESDCPQEDSQTSENDDPQMKERLQSLRATVEKRLGLPELMVFSYDKQGCPVIRDGKTGETLLKMDKEPACQQDVCREPVCQTPKALAVARHTSRSNAEPIDIDSAKGNGPHYWEYSLPAGEKISLRRNENGNFDLRLSDLSGQYKGAKMEISGEGITRKASIVVVQKRRMSMIEDIPAGRYELSAGRKEKPILRLPIYLKEKPASDREKE